MFYTLENVNGNMYTYKVTLKLYRDCFSTGAQLDNSAPIAVFDNGNNSMVRNFIVDLLKIDQLEIGSPDPCISNPPVVCYQVGFYEFEVTLPASTFGYTITYQRCCRIAGINNLIGSSSVGATYTAQIPGTRDGASHPSNNSARFVGKDTVIVCANSSLLYSFAAEDEDGDELRYYFCNAYVGGGTAQGPAGGPNTPSPNPPTAPPYNTVPYSPTFNASSPLGNLVSIDTRTGTISGIAPDAGIYVVTVCVDEIRNGVKIATQRKDLQIKIASCQTTDASLKPDYVSCDGFTLNFRNEAPPSSLVRNYYWDFGVPGRDDDTANTFQHSFTFPDTGQYTITLITNRGEECSDTAYAVAKVYPGFFPGFTYSGICVNKPTQFTDTTRTRYGVVDSWQWDFGDPQSPNDASQIQNPTYTYSQLGTNTVRFIVTSSKGCIDTVYRDIPIIDKPPLSVSARDTLMCRGDATQLQAIGNGNFTWTPAANIRDANTATPSVSPTATTTYYVELDDNGCKNTDSVRVRVVSVVTLQARPDTVICLTDQAPLYAASDGLRFQWSPATTVDRPDSLFTMARPDATTTYTITARIGSCQATDDVIIRTIPYPQVNAGPDTTVCFETPAQLHGSTDGTSFSWTPVGSLVNAQTLNPIATPRQTTAYALTALDSVRGCPKPASDTVVVNVLPEILAFAGRDTAVVVNQELQFQATGGVEYQWSPPTALNNPNIATPTAIYGGEFDNIQYKVQVFNEVGCVDSAFVRVRIFKTNPQIFVPTAFTPNGDGINDVIRPIAAGISRIEYFRIYNRWGQMVFSTTTNGHGWDGRIGGKEQGANVYVWLVKGVDFTGKEFFAKGTVTLIR